MIGIGDGNINIGKYGEDEFMGKHMILVQGRDVVIYLVELECVCLCEF